MRKSLGIWGLAAALSLCLTACGGGDARYGANNGGLYGNDARNNANSNGTVTDGDGTLTGDGVTDFGDTARKRLDGDGATAYDGSAAYGDGATAYDDRSMLEEASDALENGVRRARDGLENAGDAIRDMNANNRIGS